MLCSSKRQTTNQYTDESQKYSAKLKKPNTKLHFAWFHLYEISRESKSQEKSKSQESINSC